MYYEHFGLSGAPFEFNPSASVLYMSAGHREALAALEWGLREPSGFTMLVGEIGTGKTTLIYSLLASNHQGVRTAWVANPRISFEEMLRQVLSQLGANQPETAGKLTLLQALDAQLASIGAEDCIALIIDEAQDLSDDALEDIRLLSNFQSLERRRLQIVLVGQIDLAKRLARPQLRQLNQRIGARALLPTLQGREIYDYIEYRIRSRGGDIERLFTRGAIREVSRASGGIPRRINVLCHNALFLAFADGQRCVAERYVQDAVRDYDHLLVNQASMPAKMAASASAAIQSASTAMRAAGASMRSATTRAAAPSNPAKRAASAPMQSVAAVESFIPSTIPEVPSTIPEMPSTIPEMRPRASRSGRAMVVSLFLALCVLGIAGAGFAELQLARHDLPALVQRFSSQAARLKALIVVDRDASQIPTKSDQDKISSVPSGNELKNSQTTHVSKTSGSRQRKRQPETSSEPKVLPINLPPVKAPARNIPPSQEASPKENQTAARTESTVLVKAGDSMSKIARRLYGSFDDVNRLTAANPEIKDANVIYPGQTIRVQQASK